MRQALIKLAEFLLGESPAKRDRRRIETASNAFVEGIAEGLNAENPEMPSAEAMDWLRDIYHSSLLYQPDDEK